MSPDQGEFDWGEFAGGEFSRGGIIRTPMTKVKIKKIKTTCLSSVFSVHRSNCILSLLRQDA